MDVNEINTSIASNERIQKLVEEAQAELLKIQPEIDYLEQCQKKLFELKDQQFKLNSLILSLKSVIKISDVNNNTDDVINKTNVSKPTESKLNDVNITHVNTVDSRKIFMPDQAISQVKNYLRTKNNLNYEIFKSVVFNSGIATTEEIKNYFIENNIKQPKSGKTFHDVELKEISSRANYLVRKNLLVSTEPGIFRSVFGWVEVQ